LVLGDDPSHLFTVNIPDNDNVSALKKEIWKEKQNAFKGVDADRLDLRTTRNTYMFSSNVHRLVSSHSLSFHLTFTDYS
jgi:hypothetical protein